ncbi:hypothetical protein [Amycolatopsis decaplanina]|nr:hypothetical protein [Amycolatopsis decaplanina]
MRGRIEFSVDVVPRLAYARRTHTTTTVTVDGTLSDSGQSTLA